MADVQKFLSLFGLGSPPTQPPTQPPIEPEVEESKPFINIQDAAFNLNNATLLLYATAMKK